MRSTQTFSGLFLAALLAGPFSAVAEEEPAVRADLNFASRYVFRGLEWAGASAQTAFKLSRDNLRGGVSANLPLTAHEGREVNLDAAYLWSPRPDLKVEPSARAYWIAGQAGENVGHSFEAGLKATLPAIRGFIPTLSYARDIRLRADTVEVSAGRSIALTGVGSFLDLNFFGGLADGSDWRPDAPGVRQRDGYTYWGAEAHLPYRIGAHSTLIAGAHYADTAGRSAVNGPFSMSAGQNFWFSLGVSLDF